MILAHSNELTGDTCTFMMDLRIVNFCEKELWCILNGFKLFYCQNEKTNQKSTYLDGSTTEKFFNILCLQYHIGDNSSKNNFE